MLNKIDKNDERKIRAKRVRTKVSGTPDRPRLNVFRSLNNIYAQIIDDENGVTLASASTQDKALAKDLKGKKKQECAFIIGKNIGELALSKNIKKVVFDRAGYIFTGRVKNVADGAREAGLEF